mmetsp:Transcript_35371/g.88730  ORF Transcript_35371/g.88730 Transcript_35371/m.88730 type:complete len:254 (+) Transcript_35371:1105-1866(+)
MLRALLAAACGRPRAASDCTAAGQPHRLGTGAQQHDARGGLQGAVHVGPLLVAPPHVHARQHRVPMYLQEVGVRLQKRLHSLVVGQPASQLLCQLPVRRVAVSHELYFAVHVKYRVRALAGVRSAAGRREREPLKGSQKVGVQLGGLEAAGADLQGLLHAQDVQPDGLQRSGVIVRPPHCRLEGCTKGRRVAVAAAPRGGATPQRLLGKVRHQLPHGAQLRDRHLQQLPGRRVAGVNAALCARPPQDGAPGGT